VKGGDQRSVGGLAQIEEPATAVPAEDPELVLDPDHIETRLGSGHLDGPRPRVCGDLDHNLGVE
jgi:hypothetical protein